ncbi:head GIN domain-containing protein [soil metagenome]
MPQKHFYLPILLIGITSLFLSSCSKTIDGEGEVIQQTRSLKSFTDLTLDISANITVVISDSVSCVISAQSNIADIIEMDEGSSSLKIKSKNDYRATKPVEIIISTQSIEKIAINGSGDIHVLNGIKGKSLKLNINGSGDIDLALDVEELRSMINGSGNLNLSGKAASHRLQINGSGNAHAFDLAVDDYKISLNGSGDAEVTAKSSFDAKVIGSGNVIYKGAPTVKTVVTGSGTVTKSNE